MPAFESRSVPFHGSICFISNHDAGYVRRDERCTICDQSTTTLHSFRSFLSHIPLPNSYILSSSSLSVQQIHIWVTCCYTSLIAVSCRYTSVSHLTVGFLHLFVFARYYTISFSLHHLKLPTTCTTCPLKRFHGFVHPTGPPQCLLQPYW